MICQDRSLCTFGNDGTDGVELRRPEVPRAQYQGALGRETESLLTGLSASELRPLAVLGTPRGQFPFPADPNLGL